MIDPQLFVAFVLAVVLHAAWDIVNSLNVTTVTQVVIMILGNLAIVVLSLTLLIRRVRESGRERLPIDK